MRTLPLLLLLIVSLHPARAQNSSETDASAIDNEPAESSQAVSLAILAERAEVIAIAQVIETQYTKIRGFPNKGSAVLTVLIPYRGTSKGELLEVEEEGLEQTACYYPEVGPFQFEGERFLVFLKRAPGKKTLRGRLPGCQIPILVTQDSHYALKYPVEGIEVPRDAVEELLFSDPNAYIDAGELSFAEADALAASDYARRVESDDPFAPDLDQFVYTRGIPITALRLLMFPDTKQ